MHSHFRCIAFYRVSFAKARVYFLSSKRREKKLGGGTGAGETELLLCPQLPLKRYLYLCIVTRFVGGVSLQSAMLQPSLQVAAVARIAHFQPGHKMLFVVV